MIDVELVALAPSMTEGRVGRWLKAVGAPVRAGEALVEIETDKTLIELEAPADGVLEAILVTEGTEGVQVGTALARIAPGLPAAVGDTGAAPAAARPEPAVSPLTSVGAPGPVPVAATRAIASGAGAAPSRSPLPAEPRPVRATPLAERVAALAGLPLDPAWASHADGVVRLRDLPLASARQVAEPQASAPTSTARAPSPPAARLVAHAPYRRVIARRLTEAKQRVPHFYLEADVDAGALLQIREEINARPGAAGRVSVTDLVVRAVAVALRIHPDLNAHWSEEGALRQASVDVGIAVATGAGLVAPLLRDAPSLGLLEIAAATRALIERARRGELHADEYTGGSCTVSNLGMHGIDALYPILNPPQATIVGVGRIRRAPVVRGEAVVPGHVMRCSLSADHRLLDGAVASAFLAEIRELLEHPVRLIL